MNKLRDLAAGSVLGRYELVLRVASGGMGEVWAARIKGTRGFQKVVALKTLLPELSQNPNFEQMFLDEAALAARIKHPNVVQVIDLGEEEEVLFQVMEWVSGESLWGIMRAASKRGGIPLEVAARIIYQVCAGLHAAHELKDEEGESIGLVHRDISPQNILLNGQGIAKVVDFGVAKFAGRGVAATQVGELRGKVPYMAPEHIHGQEIDRRADAGAFVLSARVGRAPVPLR
jgi:eukaryotic-like serine/threonine-protein kinase